MDAPIRVHALRPARATRAAPAAIAAASAWCSEYEFLADDIRLTYPRRAALHRARAARRAAATAPCRARRSTAPTAASRRSRPRPVTTRVARRPADRRDRRRRRLRRSRRARAGTRRRPTSPTARSSRAAAAAQYRASTRRIDDARRPLRETTALPSSCSACSLPIFAAAAGAVSDQAHPHRHSVRARLVDRRDHAHPRAEPVGAALGQPIVIEPEARRRRRHLGDARSRAPRPTATRCWSAAAARWPRSRTCARTRPTTSLRDFTPITDIGRYTVFMYVNSNVPAKTLAGVHRLREGQPRQAVLRHRQRERHRRLRAVELAAPASTCCTCPYKSAPPAMLDLVCRTASRR